MDFSFELEFDNVPDTRAIERHIRRKLQRLDQKYIGIKDCHFSINIPYTHRYPGSIFQMQLEVNTPDHRLIVSRQPSADGASRDIFAIISKMFSDMNHKLQNSACACVLSAQGKLQQRDVLTKTAGDTKQTEDIDLLYRSDRTWPGSEKDEDESLAG